MLTNKGYQTSAEFFALRFQLCSWLSGSFALPKTESEPFLARSSKLVSFIVKLN